MYVPRLGYNFFISTEERVLGLAQELGFNFLEVCLEYPFLEKRGNIIKRIKEYGFELAFESPSGAVQIFNPIQQISKASISIINKHLNFCEKFDPLYFNFHQFIDISTYNYLEKTIVERIEKTAKMLSKKDLPFPLVFENTPRRSLSLPQHFAFVKKFPNLFVCLDIGHLPKVNKIYGHEINISDWCEAYPNKILTLHLHNSVLYRGNFIDHLPLSLPGLIKKQEIEKLVKRSKAKFIVLETIYGSGMKTKINKNVLGKDVELVKQLIGASNNQTKKKFKE